jgi:hypothetical protein
MNPISLTHLHMLLLPSPCSHWSATGPRSNTQPSNTRNTQRKTTRALAARVKPVRPLCQTGQTGFARLSQPPTHQNRSDLFPKPVTPVSPRELKLKDPKLKQTDSNLGETWTRASSTRGRLVPRRSPKHTFDQTGHTSFAQKTPKEQQGQKPSKRTPNATKLGPGDFLGKEQHACQNSS